MLYIEIYVLNLIKGERERDGDNDKERDRDRLQLAFHYISFLRMKYNNQIITEKVNEFVLAVGMLRKKKDHHAKAETISKLTFLSQLSQNYSFCALLPSIHVRELQTERCSSKNPLTVHV